MQKATLIHRWNRDRPGGHFSGMIQAKLTSWPEWHTGTGRAYCKRRVNKQMRRQHPKITAEALFYHHHDILDELYDQAQAEWELYYEFQIDQDRLADEQESLDWWYEGDSYNYDEWDDDFDFHPDLEGTSTPWK